MSISLLASVRGRGLSSRASCIVRVEPSDTRRAWTASVTAARATAIGSTRRGARTACPRARPVRRRTADRRRQARPAAATCHRATGTRRPAIAVLDGDRPVAAARRKRHGRRQHQREERRRVDRGDGHERPPHQPPADPSVDPAADPAAATKHRRHARHQLPAPSPSASRISSPGRWSNEGDKGVIRPRGENHHE